MSCGTGPRTSGAAGEGVAVEPRVLSPQTAPRGEGDDSSRLFLGIGGVVPDLVEEALFDPGLEGLPFQLTELLALASG